MNHGQRLPADHGGRRGPQGRRARGLRPVHLLRGSLRVLESDFPGDPL